MKTRLAAEQAQARETLARVEARGVELTQQLTDAHPVILALRRKLERARYDLSVIANLPWWQLTHVRRLAKALSEID